MKIMLATADDRMAMLDSATATTELNCEMISSAGTSNTPACTHADRWETGRHIGSVVVLISRGAVAGRVAEGAPLSDQNAAANLFAHRQSRVQHTRGRVMLFSESVKMVGAWGVNDN